MRDDVRLAIIHATRAQIPPRDVVYANGRSGLRRQLTRRLRTGRPLRKRRRRATERRTRYETPRELALLASPGEPDGSGVVSVAGRLSGTTSRSVKIAAAVDSSPWTSTAARRAPNNAPRTSEEAT
jgi:hypothetical protein